jgi:beta-lactam-binding protein with PASTA domain
MAKKACNILVLFCAAAALMIFGFLGWGQTPEKVKVPRVVGDWEVNARSTIELAGLTVGPVAYTRTMSPNLHNIVEWQQPLPGTEVAAGRPVTIKVFQYNEDRTKIVKLPNFVGMNAVRAQSLLQKDRLVGVISSIPSKNAKDKGLVNKQNPPAGTEVGQGAKIALEIFE